MKRKTKRLMGIILLAGVVLALLAMALPILGREEAGPSLLWGNVSNGYSNSIGDGFRIAATAGQVDGSLPVSGDGFQVTGGLWAFVAEPPPAPAPQPQPGYGLYFPLTIR